MTRYWPYLSLLVAALSFFNAILASWPANLIWAIGGVVWGSNYFLAKRVSS